MDINELMKMDFVVDNMEDIEDEMPDFILELKKDPSKTGLDLNAPVTMFMNFGKKVKNFVQILSEFCQILFQTLLLGL